jgi:hypothetical protein
VERYVSLLRHIAGKSNSDGTPYYTSVVIAAHSLGALISADLLHFLRREGDPELEKFGAHEYPRRQQVAAGHRRQRQD